MTVGPVYRELPEADLSLRSSRATIIKGGGRGKSGEIEPGHVAAGNTCLTAVYNGCIAGSRVISCYGD